MFSNFSLLVVEVPRYYLLNRDTFMERLVNIGCTGKITKLSLCAFCSEVDTIDHLCLYRNSTKQNAFGKEYIGLMCNRILAPVNIKIFCLF